MKKFVAGLLVGLLLTFAGIAGADTISSIGKKIDSEYKVTANGKTLENKAIAINGVSYLPVREVSSIAGFDVKFSSAEGIILTSQDEAEIKDNPAVEGTPVIPSTPEPISTPEPAPTIEPAVTISYLNEQIRRLQEDIRVLRGYVNKSTSEEDKKTGEARIAELEVALADLEAQKAALQP